MIPLPRLALLLSAILVNPVQAAVSPATPAVTADPVEEIAELEEVLVRGKLVANALAVAESRTFRLYNQLNKDNRFDVQCGDINPRLNRDTLAVKHGCAPEFLYLYAPTVHYIPVTTPSLSLFTDVTTPGAGRTEILPTSTTSYIWYQIPGSARSIPAALQAEFAQNMQRVFDSDPALKEMASNLSLMYQEMDRTQAHYLKLQQERRMRQASRREAARERADARGLELRPTHPRAPQVP